VLVLCLSTAKEWARGSLEENEKTERLFVAWLCLCLHGVGGCAARACASQLTTTFTVYVVSRALLFVRESAAGF
jgi:hypothetical protein